MFNNIRDVLLFVFFVIIIIGGGLVTESYMHQREKDAYILSRYLFADIGKILKALLRVMWEKLKDCFRKPVIRHYYDESIWPMLINTVTPYANPAFDVGVRVAWDGEPEKSAVYMRIEYIAARNLTKQEREDAAQLALVQLRGYLNARLMDWPVFVAYISNGKKEVIKIYYLELEKDKEHFQKRYSTAIKEQSSNHIGVLRDAELDEELSGVD